MFWHLLEIAVLAACAVAFVFVVFAFAVQSAWLGCDPFWRSPRHHDHLIPPEPRSYRRPG